MSEPIELETATIEQMMPLLLEHARDLTIRFSIDDVAWDDHTYGVWSVSWEGQHETCSADGSDIRKVLSQIITMLQVGRAMRAKGGRR